MLRISRIVLGTLLLILGLIGFFVPILQGWFFVGIGAVLLYRDIPYLRRLAHRFNTRFPGITRTVADWKTELAGRRGEARVGARREEERRESKP